MTPRCHCSLKQPDGNEPYGNRTHGGRTGQTACRALYRQGLWGIFRGLSDWSHTSV